MFGYFKIKKRKITPAMRRVYKNYYCGTCFALEKNYGQLSRFLLSYDVVILGLLLKCHKEPEQNRLKCLGQNAKKGDFYDDDWKKIAAINILLFSAKIDDDIHDENSFMAKFAGGVFKKPLNKAKSDYPELACIISEGYREMAKLEDANSGVLSICDCFADMMEKLICSAFEANNSQIEYVKAISRWLYLIDQLDDYDDDVKHGKNNPCVIEGVCKKEYINQHQVILRDTLGQIIKEINMVKSKMTNTSYENKLLYSIVNDSIPTVTLGVMLNGSFPQFEKAWRVDRK